MSHGHEHGQRDVPTDGFGSAPPPFAPEPPAHPPAFPPPPAHPPAFAPVAGHGPEFVAADQYNGLVVDAEGVHFEQGPHAIDLPWAHVRTVHAQPLPEGLSVTAVMADGPVYECRVRARRRAQATQWSTDLAGVLHHYLQGRG
ncbi:hypothetical protein GTY65_06245 [Streptomyces sp. SID8379]|uniref:hypothetical protein n=1 Tax=unclassified Streptomyces TaxID=2593676 RepID=UPI000381697E|nr:MULTISPECIES: hypothetical protein [unclassified Streptomyces]MYW63680.1 hypothetical protein [Streptomyces sp. SID8379]